MRADEFITEDLRKWFKEKWVRFGPDGKIRGDCARGSDSEGKPKCLPQSKAHALGKKGRKYAASKKRREDPDPERRGKAKNVATKKKSNEGVVKSPNFQKMDKPLTEDIEALSSLVNQDQAERNEYAQFVKSQANGDWTKGAEMYSKLKKRPKNDIFDDAARLKQFMNMKFDFDKFTDQDWDNYWLLAQHCDNNRDFQKNALSIIKKYQGTDHSNYKYLYDRISVASTGKQKYGTQNVNGQQGVAEEQLDELKCWSGYTRVKGVPAGAPGSCKKKTKESVEDDKCPHCGGELVSEEMLNEKKDACYYKVKSRYKVWPSAYASGALVKCRKVGAKNWGKKSESISEAYDQQAADNALFTAMKELAKDIKPKIAEIVVRKAESRSWNNQARMVNRDVSHYLYQPYLRQAFHTPDTKNELTDEKVQKLLITKYPIGKFGSELHIIGEGSWRYFFRNDRSKFEQSKQDKKMYQTLDTSMDINQLDKIITDLANYLSSDESDATGFFGFKVPTGNYGKEADSLVAYFSPGYDLTSMGASVIKTIVNNAQRPKHRAVYGTDIKNAKFSKHYDRLAGHESDSSMLLIKFGDYLVDKAEQLNDYFKKYDDNMVAKILVKTWKDKFEAKDWQTFGENKGLPMPGTYEQEYDMFKRKGPERITAITSESEELQEKWSEKYKRSINCNNPKGFSQKAHCQGKKKK